MSTLVAEKGHAFDEATKAGYPPYKVADLGLAAFGRKEIRLPSRRCPALWLSDASMQVSGH